MCIRLAIYNKNCITILYGQCSCSLSLPLSLSQLLPPVKIARSAIRFELLMVQCIGIAFTRMPSIPIARICVYSSDIMWLVYCCAFCVVWCKSVSAFSTEIGQNECDYGERKWSLNVIKTTTVPRFQMKRKMKLKISNWAYKNSGIGTKT